MSRPDPRTQVLLLEEFHFLFKSVPPADLLDKGISDTFRGTITTQWTACDLAGRCSLYQQYCAPTESRERYDWTQRALAFLELSRFVRPAEGFPMTTPSYTPSNTFKRLIALIGKLMPPTTTIFTPAPVGAESMETPVFYRARFLDASIHLEGFLLLPSDDKTAAERESMCVNPEEDFVKNQCFWVASPAQIFRDANPAIDKGRKLAWMAAFDRDCIYETFCVNLNEPVVSMSFSVKLLERLAEAPQAKSLVNRLIPDPPVERPRVTGVLDNSVSSAANAIAKRKGADADDMQSAGVSLTGLSTTLNDGPNDKPPTDSQPTLP